MNIPTFVQDKAVITEGEDAGHFTSQWNLFMTQLIDQMQFNLSNEGFVPPNQSTTNIDTIAASDLENFTNEGLQKIRLLMDSTTNELKAIVNGTVKTVTLV